MDIFEAINSRHSTRDYLPETPSDALIKSLTDAAIRAPCAGGARDWLLLSAFLNPFSQLTMDGRLCKFLQVIIPSPPSSSAGPAMTGRLRRESPYP